MNANNSNNIANFIGSVSETIHLPYSEWGYLADENNNGFPDYIDVITNWIYLLDSDEDRLPDCIEEYLGTDLYNVDTDGDSIPDGYEFFKLGSDPLLADTLLEGKTDGEYDYDEDGLTNLEEYNNDTEPWYSDTDNDRLKDGEEVHTHGSNPLVVDTDGDSLDDSDEISLGTNPTIQDTDGDGVLDCDEKFNQTFTHDVYNENCAVSEVHISMNGTGNIQKTTTVESIMETDNLCSNVVGLVGEPFSIESTSQFDHATITFKIDQTKLGDTSFDSLIFLWYDEENYEFIEMETTYDINESTVSVATTHFSKYMIVDKNKWFEAWNTELNYTNVSYEESKCYTVLAVDCSGSMSSNDPITVIPPTSAPYQQINDCARRNAVMNYISSMDADDKAAIVTFESNANTFCSLTDDKSALNAATSNFYNGGGTSFDAAIRQSIDILNSSQGGTRKKIILLSDGASYASDNLIDEAIASFIKIYTIGLGNSADTTLQDISNRTGGEFFKAYTADELLKIYEDIGIGEDFDTTDNDGDGLYDVIETVGIRIQNGQVEEIIYTDPTNPDSDSDGLMDGEEIEPTIRRKSKSIYVTAPESSIEVQYYFAMISDPNVPDSDGDGYSDYDEVKTHASDPLTSDVITVELANPYISIDTTGEGTLINHQYGGQQDWLYDESDSTKNDIKSKQLKHGGCGVIASCDTILYIQKYHDLDLTVVNTSNDLIQYNEYDQFVRSYADNYLVPFDVESLILDSVTRTAVIMISIRWGSSWPDCLEILNSFCLSDSTKLLSDLISNDTGTWGCDPLSLANELNQFYIDQGVTTMNYSHHLAELSTREELETIISNSLQEDIPPILLAGVGGTITYMYEGETSMSNEVKNHFITITAINIDKISNKTILTSSTWSRKAFVDLESVVNNPGLIGGVTVTDSY